MIIDRASFRSVPTSALNMVDPANAISQWSKGTSLLDKADLQVPGISTIHVVTVGFHCNLGLKSDLGLPYGKVGNLYGGLTLAGSLSPTGVNYPYDDAMQPLPNDANLFTKIWDGELDSLPPFGPTDAPNSISLLPVQAALQPPISIEISDLTNLLIGLWLTPSLTQNVAVFVANAAYSIIYDWERGP